MSNSIHLLRERTKVVHLLIPLLHTRLTYQAVRQEVDISILSSHSVAVKSSFMPMIDIADYTLITETYLGPLGVFVVINWELHKAGIKINIK